MTTKFTRPLLLVGGGADRVAVHYATGFDAPDPFLCLVRPGNVPLLVVSPLELGRAKALEPKVEVVSTAKLPLNRRAKNPLLQQALTLTKIHAFRRLTLSGACPASLLRGLEKNGIQVSLLDAPPFPERRVKSSTELRCIRQTQRAAVAAMKAAFRCIEESTVSDGLLYAPDGRTLTAESIRATIDHVLLDHACLAEETIVAGGDQAVDPHERGSGPLPAHAPIVLDIFPRSRVHGYWGDITRTVLKGTAGADQRALYRSVARAQRTALGMAGPGVSGAAIHQAVVEQFESDGFASGMMNGIPQGFIHGTGHGVGLEIHEAPSVSPRGGPLEEGEVITIEPGLYYKGIGGVRIEDTVVVTATGCRPLATCSKRFIL